MHLHFERNVNAKCDCSILSLSWMGKVPDELPEEEGWKLNRNNYYQEGWLATGNVRGIVGVTFTSSHARRPHELPLRTNYNLRGHRSDVILVKWNEPYQKLASCDSSGVIFVWIKYEGRWSIELINDRSTPVTHFSWSHDGRMALICYQDGFVLVGSVAGQRYWSSMLSLDKRITAGCWTPDDTQVYLGTASAQLVVMDVHGAMVSQVQLAAEGGITTMAWSCEKFKMEEGEDTVENPTGHVLAVALGNGELVLMRGHDDVSPIRIDTGLSGSTLVMEWANSKELLAVAGTVLPEGEDAGDNPPFKNVVKFYSDAGALIYTVLVPYTQARVSCVTWGHCARRLFVALGGAVLAARVWRAVAPLQLLARVSAARSLPGPRAALRLPLPPALRPKLAALFANTIRCNVPERHEVRGFVSRPPGGAGRLHCTMLRHDEDETPAYTLYLEHLGGLVPLLKGKRTSKIRPEFVIFDPQTEGQGTVILASATESGGGGGGGGAGTRAEGSPPARGEGGPASPRAARHAPHYTDSSDTERDEGCSGSPRMPRRRRARRKMRASSEKEDSPEDLAYIDSLPEDVRLVEVTSNIWGTKFKMHGLAKNVPSNLGQVTYKTSLLHLQPRQMTLMITELRDDLPVGPDPNFNPNIFSEDEEEVSQASETNSTPTHTNNNVRRKLTLNERVMNASNIQTENSTNNNITPNPVLARAESYDEFPFIDVNETVNVTEPVHTLRHTQAERRVSSTTSCGNRHAISPLRCESSVPTLQSPKNAVAPTDIIFERPSPQAVSCGGRGDFCSGRAEYSVRDNASLKGNNIEQQPFSLNLTLEPGRQVTIKKCDTHVTENCLSKLRKNICSRGETTSFDVNTRILKSLCSKSYEHEVHPDAVTRREPLRSLHRNDELKFIDEEAPAESTSGAADRGRAAPVSPAGAAGAGALLVVDMPRSCSVGYLDLVEPGLLQSRVSFPPLLEPPPRRLVLVGARRPRRPPRRAAPPDPHEHRAGPGDAACARAPGLNKCGKSKSLDSSELTVGADSRGGGGGGGGGRRHGRGDAAGERRGAAASAPPAPPAPPPPRPAPADSDSDYSKYYRSLEQLAMRLLASRSKRGAGAGAGGAGGESASAPASPRAARSQPASPAAPRARPRAPRHSSASPIRQLLNSPLLNRRRHKKQSESSDEETSNGYSEVNGRNYRDLETFQKTQLRNKLKRNNGYIALGGGGGEARCGNVDRQRRQLVMHNKAPMWNENSQVYQLDFGGRVTQESAKNFQIEYHGKQVMQFGRIDGNAYTLDFQYPFSALQAFAVALANVTQRLK